MKPSRLLIGAWAFVSGLFLTGCTTCSAAKEKELLTVEDLATGRPVQAIRIDRYSPRNFWERMGNPIAATYFPDELRATYETDALGHARVAYLVKGEYIYIDFKNDESTYKVVFLGKEVMVSTDIDNYQGFGRRLVFRNVNGTIATRVVSLGPI